MTRKEYKDVLKYELYKSFENCNPGFITKIRVKYFQPNTNCTYLARKMWYLYSRGKIGRIRAKFLYLKILRKYNCCIYPHISVDKGFHVAHPVGIVIGDCTIGKDFAILQNCTIGVKSGLDNINRTYPVIGDNVTMGASSLVLGNVKVCDNVIIGANSLVISDICESGVYVGSPVRKAK